MSSSTHPSETILSPEEKHVDATSSPDPTAPISPAEEKLTPAKVAAPPTPTVLTAPAWLSVAGASACLFSTFGFSNAFGVFQDYYETTLLPDSSPNAIAWVGSVSFGLIFLGGMVGGLLMDRFGPRPLFIYQAIVYPLSAMLTSLCTEYYQILLAQGILQGLSLACSFSVPIACCMIWFKEKKGIAIGIVVSFSSLGGVVWPIIVKALLDNVGFGWTWRAIGFIVFGLLCFTAATVTSPLPQHQTNLRLFKGKSTSPEKESAPGPAPPRQPFFYAEAFRHLPYDLFALAYFFVFLGLTYTLFFLPTWGGTKGLSSSLQVYSLSILNAASIFGRLLVPIAADKLGAFNLIIFCAGACMIIVFASMGVTGPAGVLVVGGFYGFTSGGVISLLASCTASVTPDLRRISSALGQLSACAAVAALLGSPICGWIIASPAGFTGAQGFSGGSLGLGALLMVSCGKGQLSEQGLISTRSRNVRMAD
ncbi:MFS general substrate transporter [Microstroma glucosiphilum]|uniref:MFS general substrate transporter n=1 Tax=Pseudomicrostroma glucosiphilum TaxID=1684307 RepID=A0A316U8J1_9BASI|nr:MFS general substrate transporter [Pseudomicrostroma glucosiphilum]PWN21526.1 MFS general substrate transporter [Pseudomicrostroma glucosiphilum]